MNELYRLLHNLVRIGTVSDVDHERQRVRVVTSGNVTDWIRWGEARAGDARTWWPLSVGEQVLIVAPGGDLATAVVACRLYSAAHPAPGSRAKTHITVYPDGASETYDANTSTMTISGVKKVIVEAAESITLDTPEVTCTQHLTAKTLTVQEGAELHGDTTHTDGEMSSNGVIVDKHVHSDVMPGGANSGGPQ